MTDQKNKQQKMPHMHPEKPDKKEGRHERASKEDDMKKDGGMPYERRRRGAGTEHPNAPERKKTEIGDKPNEVKRKIPNMHK